MAGTETHGQATEGLGHAQAQQEEGGRPRAAAHRRRPPEEAAARDEGSGCERLDAERSIERSEARCEARSEGDWQKACGEQQRRGELDENSGEPEMHEINSSLKILVDLGELEAVEQFSMPVELNARARKPLVQLPPSPQPPRPPRAPDVRPRKRGGAFRADVEAGIIPPPRGMRPDAC